jgi:hypothetical protein
MRWSKLKKSLEDNFAPSVRGRVALHQAAYRHTRNEEGRCWITVDKADVYSFCSLKALMMRYRIAEEIRQANGSTDFRNKRHQTGYYAAYDQADAISHKKGVYSRWEFTRSALEFLNMPIGESLASPNPIHRALAILDRRVGKRRLAAALEPGKEKHSLVRLMLETRGLAEGLRIDRSESRSKQ